MGKKKTKKKQNKQLTANRNYKDTLFRFIFKELEKLLELFNAVNNTSYTDVNELKITTLENVIFFLKIKERRYI